MKLLQVAIALLALAPAPASAYPVAQPSGPELVVLLHGLARSAGSMDVLSGALKDAGFEVCNVGYPSTELPIDTLASDIVLPEILGCAGPEPRAVNFVTHSMGGIIVRQLRASDSGLRFGRVVMLGPPNQGSEVVDALGELAPFEWLNGPAGQELGTGEESVPRALGATDLEVGVIAGRRSINPMLSMIIPGEDDGKVAVENTRLEGMRDFLVVSVSHPFLMKSPEVIRQAIHFLRSGRFDHEGQKIADGRGP